MTLPQKGITVYCGSSAGNNPAYARAAEVVGAEIGRRGLPLIYGGGHMGLMGAVGRSVREAGGTTVAVIPRFMVERGWNDASASETVVTESMHERKKLMAECARGIIALPGGVGTFEELCEIITWRQLGLFTGNIVVLNVEGYYDAWRRQFEKAVEEGFFPASHLDLFHITSSPVEAVELASAAESLHTVDPKF